MSEKKEETKMDGGKNEYEKFTDSMGDELMQIHGGKRGYIQWLEGHSPFWVRLIAYMMTEVSRGFELQLPLPIFKALGRVFLDLNRLAFEMWKERDWFEMHKRPIPPGIN
jgi:hypothetical protein